MNYKVTYMARSGNEDDAIVKVDATTDHNGQPCFYATNLRLWGCGKNAATPEAAIRMLVQDQATILHIAKEA
jgi:hypothetical protein